MTIKLKVARFRTRRPDPVTPRDPAPRDPNLRDAAPRDPSPRDPAARDPKPRDQPPRDAGPRNPRIGNDAFFPSADDGFGTASFPTARARPAPQDDTAPPDTTGAQDIDAIRREGLTGRQLRMARRLAQKHGLPATSDFDAVRLLRRAGIDPMQRSSVLELVDAEHDGESGGSPGSAPSRALTVAPQRDDVKLPQTVKPIKLPSTETRAEQAHIAEVARIQRDMAKRRRRKMLRLMVRLFFFVGLPTLIAGWYYYLVATPLYSSRTEFVIQQAEPAAQAGLGSLLGGTAFATSQDSIAVQGYLQSPEAMGRLNDDQGFRAHFSEPDVDPIQRLAPDATNASVYKTYKRNVKIAYDPTEGIIKMEVSATSPERTLDFSRALIRYAEEQVDHLTQRLREDQMSGALESYADAEAKMLAAQRKTVELQEKFKILSSEVEVGLIVGQIGTLEGQLTADRLSLAQMQSNENPNAARMDPLIRRIATLESEVAALRAKLTVDGEDGLSLAKVQSELLVAQADVTTRQLMLGQALQAMESARVEANRQTRYLSISVNPILPDEPSYPRAFENTLVVMLIFLGIYLMITMTVAILQEQLTS